MAKLTPCYLLALEARFMKHVEVAPSGCRVWRGTQSRGGKRPSSGPYGSFYIDREHNAVRAHVFSAFLDGKIPSLRVPSGHNLDHHCEHGHGTLCLDCIKLVPEEVNRELRWTRPLKKVDARHESGLSSASA